MHYLEDYLELVEPLREVIREKLILMRENDLKLQADFAQLEEDSSTFLNNYRLYQKQSLLSPTETKINIHGLSSSSNDQLTAEQIAAKQEKQIEYDKLIERYEQLNKLTTTKIDLANESYDFIERYYKKLENDLNKFKMELEADYSGLTEILEKRFANEGYNEIIDENSTLDPSLFNLESFFDPFDELTDDYTNQSTLGYLVSQARHLPSGLHSRGRKRLQNHSNKRKRNLIQNSNYFPSNDLNELSSDHYMNSISSSNLFDNNEQLIESIDERHYCFCNELSYGDMIACDNPTCAREWFHYSCVGIITPPKGKWFCDECTPISTVKHT